MASKKTMPVMNGRARRSSLAAPTEIRQSREKASRFAILGMLALGRKKSGYDLKKAIASSTANFWSESYGNIYPALKKLLAEGAIREESDKGPASGRQKQLYSITDEGRRALRQWLRQPVAPRSEDNELLLKLFFGAMMPARDSQALVAAHRDHHRMLLEKFAAIEKIIAAGPTTDEQKVYLRATLSYGQAVSRALLEWSDATEETLRTLKSRLPDS